MIRCPKQKPVEPSALAVARCVPCQGLPHGLRAPHLRFDVLAGTVAFYVVLVLLIR